MLRKRMIVHITYCFYLIMCYSERKSAAADSTLKTAKPQTRTDKKKAAERQEKNRLSQQKRRKNMTGQKPYRESEKRHAYYEKKKMEKQVLQAQRRNRLNEKIQQALGSPETPSPSSQARRSAVYRLRKSFQPKNLLSSFSATVRSLWKRNPEHLKKQGVIYSSPTKTRRGTRQPPLVKQTTNEIFSCLKAKRDKETLKSKQLLLDIAD